MTKDLIEKMTIISSCIKGERTWPSELLADGQKEMQAAFGKAISELEQLEKMRELNFRLMKTLYGDQ